MALLEQQEQTDLEGVLRVLVAFERCGGASLGLLKSALKSETPRVVKPRPWPAGVDQLQQIPAHAKAWQYLYEQRRIDVQLALDARLGFGRYGWLENYVVFPSYRNGDLCYWQARATWDPPRELDPEARKRWIAETGYRKTLNPPNGEEWAGAAEVVFNLDVAATLGEVVLCEGPIDALKCGPRAAALLGKVASPQQLGLLREARVESFVVYLDSDAAAESSKLCRELSAFARVREARPPAGSDPGDWDLPQNTAILQTALPWRSGGLTGLLSRS